MIRVTANLTRYLSALADTRTDGELLAAFLATRDETAFAELVHRHGSLVWSACRRLLPDTADVEDAFQATFLVLVRRAHRLTCRATLGPWLYQVAAWTARNVRRRNARTLARRVPLPASTPDPSPGPTAADLRADLDAALLALPEKYRAPLVLCHLQGWSRRDAAARLGCGEGTLSSLLSRGLARLRDRLGSHDPTRALAFTGSALPAVLATATVQAAIAARVATAGVITSTASQLAEGVLHMFWVKKVTAASFALAVVFGLGVGAGVSVREVPGATAADGPPATASRPTTPAVSIVALEAEIADLREEVRIATYYYEKNLKLHVLSKTQLAEAERTGDKPALETLRFLVSHFEAEAQAQSRKLNTLQEGIRGLEGRLLAAQAAQRKPSTTPIVPAPQSREEIQALLKLLRDEQSGAKEVQVAASVGVRVASETVASVKQSGTPEDVAEALETLRRFEENRDSAKKRGELLQEAIAALEAQLKATEPPPTTPATPANPSKEKAVKGQILMLQLQITKLKEDHARLEKMSQDVAAARDQTARQLAELHKQLAELAQKPPPAATAASLQDALELAVRDLNAKTKEFTHLELTIGTKDAKWPFQVREVGADGKSAGAIGFENAAVLGWFVGLVAKGPAASREVQIRVQADVPYALVISIIDLCKAAGLKVSGLKLVALVGDRKVVTVPDMGTADLKSALEQALILDDLDQSLRGAEQQKPKDTTPPPLLKP